jgi:hypothetical protein
MALQLRCNQLQRNVAAIDPFLDPLQRCNTVAIPFWMSHCNVAMGGEGPGSMGKWRALQRCSGGVATPAVGLLQRCNVNN